MDGINQNNFKMKQMKKYIYLIVSIAFIFTSCKEDENLTEYPGNIIIHGSTFLNSLGSDTNSNDARIYAYSSSNENDLSLLDGENFTYELWFRANENTAIGDNLAGSGQYANGACILTRSRIFEIYLVEDDDADFALKYGRLDGLNNHVGTMSSTNSNVNLHFNEWVHVAITRSATDGIAKFYINGKLIDSSNDSLWIQPASIDTWLLFNYMYRFGTVMNFYHGALDNIRISLIDRYPNEFEPNILLKYNEIIDDDGETISNPIDDDTLLQLDLENHLTPFDPPDDFNKIEIKGKYDYYIKIHKDFFTWDSEILEEYPVTGY
jgi:hypothetical protein